MSPVQLLCYLWGTHFDCGADGSYGERFLASSFQLYLDFKRKKKGVKVKVLCQARGLTDRSLREADVGCATSAAGIRAHVNKIRQRDYTNNLSAFDLNLLVYVLLTR